MERAAKEQDPRIDFTSRRMCLAENNLKKDFRIDLVTILSAFLVLIIGMSFSAYMFYLGSKVEGTVFGGVILLAIVNSFLNFKKKKETENKSK